MSYQEKFQLYVYDGDYSLPSVDVECIKSILYTTIAKVPVQVKTLNNWRYCAFYSTPSFVHKNLTFRSFNDIVLYLRTLNYNIDRALSAKQCSESLAISYLIRSKLKPVIDFMYWLDQRNCDEFTTVWFMKALPLPFNYVHTKKLKSQAMDLTEVMYPTITNLDLIKQYLNTSATECLSTISTRLGNSSYFYGSNPTSLDVIIYAYLAPLMKLPFPCNDMSSIISMWPNLAKFVKRIDETYFPNLPKQPKYIKEKQKAPASGDDDVSYIAILILTVSATSLALGFAFSRGILSLKKLF